MARNVAFACVGEMTPRCESSGDHPGERRFRPQLPEALRLFLDWLQPSERVVVATWSHYDLWQLDLDLEAHGLPKLALPFLNVKKLAARIVGNKSFEETVRELAPDTVAMPRHRAIADARRIARILYRLVRPLA